MRRFDVCSQGYEREAGPFPPLRGHIRTISESPCYKVRQSEKVPGAAHGNTSRQSAGAGQAGGRSILSGIAFRGEAEDIVRREPELATFIYSTVLAP